MVKKNSLGRGFDVLIPTDLDRTLLNDDSERIQKLLISDIKPNLSQPRKEFDSKALSELAGSIKSHGILQPIIVIRTDNGYQVVAGERRWRAAKIAKLTHMPAVVRSLEELEQIELALIENIQRVDLSPLEQALSVYRLQQQFNLSLEEIAKKLGKAQSTVSNITRLLQLPEAAREALSKGKISEGHARAILALKAHPDKQEELLSSILHNGWSVRRAEEFVIGVKGLQNPSRKDQKFDYLTIERELKKSLGTKVNIKIAAKGGQILISFKTDQELNKIINLLSTKTE